MTTEPTRIAPVPLLRPVTDADLSDVLALNEAEVAMLSPMDEHRFHEIRRSADRFDVVEVDGRFAGFVVTFGPSADYDSENYRWFGQQFGDAFYYLDRVVLVEQVRRRGVAGRVYDEIESTATAYGLLALEVNLLPENPASLAFHRRRGYAEVGRLGDERHLVSLMTRSLRP
jgi:predicted GNAT superfamily acetyltransferase